MQLTKYSLTQIGSAALLLATAPAVALAQNPFDAANTSIATVRTTSGVTGTSDVYTIAGRIINVVLGFLGIVLLGYLLYAGFLWMTSGGESDKAEQARTMITNAIIGLVIIVAAFAISSFVLSSLVNVSR
jgi:hypothetical protein